MNIIRMLAVSVVLATAVSMVSGCSKDSDAPKYREIEGRVTGVDVATGEVSMSAYSPKQKKEMIYRGKLAPDAEIWINGATAALKDVEIDDRVTVTARIEKSDSGTQLIATKVEIERPEIPASAPTATTSPSAK